MAGVRGPSRGEVWLYRFDSPDKRRPVVVLSREELLPLLRTAMVAPITSNYRGSPSEVLLGIEEGLKEPSSVNLNHVHTVRQRGLHHYVGTLSEEKMQEICHALAIATGCA